MRFQFFTAASMKTTFFWDMIEAASTYETSVNFYQTSRRSIPEDNHLCAIRSKNSKSDEGEMWEAFRKNNKRF